MHQANLFGITPINVIAYFTKYSLLVTSFIPNYLSYSTEEIKKIKLISGCSTFIESSSKTFKVIEPILIQNDYKILEKLDNIRSFLSQFKIIKRPSHGDFHHFNLIKGCIAIDGLGTIEH